MTCTRPGAACIVLTGVRAKQLRGGLRPAWTPARGDTYRPPSGTGHKIRTSQEERPGFELIATWDRGDRPLGSRRVVVGYRRSRMVGYRRWRIVGYPTFADCWSSTRPHFSVSALLLALILNVRPTGPSPNTPAILVLPHVRHGSVCVTLPAVWPLLLL